MIGGFQHVGIGVSDIDSSMNFYRGLLGFGMKLNDHTEDVEQMVPIIGSLERMRIIMALNMAGGGAIEAVQHVSSVPRPMPGDARWGDIGYLSAGVKARRLEELVGILTGRGAEFATPVMDIEVPKGGRWRSAFLRDPDGLPIELLETAELRAAGGKPRIGGFSHVTIGVSDMDASLAFYSGILGFDVVILDASGAPEEMEVVTGGEPCRTVVLKRSRLPRGAFPLEGGMIKLVRADGFKGKPLYEGRRWGDIGIMEMAFDVTAVGEAYEQLVESGATPFCPPTSVDMGWGSKGTFAYVKDPDGNIVELVEVDKLGFLPPAVVGPTLSGILKVMSRL